MSHDLLAQATRALRDSESSSRASEGGTNPAETRARVLATLRRRRLRRLALIKSVLPIAAVLVGSAAWASSTGGLEASLRWLTASVVPSAEPPPAPVRAAVGAVSHRAFAPVSLAELAADARAAAPNAGDDDAPAGAATASVPRAPSSAAERNATARLPATRAPVEPASPARPAAAEDAESAEAAALYAAAHRAHFAERSWSAALAAWDAYLGAAPQGRFATEARYNRAICLARLGRAAEARAALEPFARGALGSYRQGEARTLLEALGGP